MPATVPGDLRSEAKSFQRDKNHNSKWTKGFVLRPGQKCPHGMDAGLLNGCSECPARPWHDHQNVRKARAIKRTNKKESAHATTLARKAFRNELDEAFDGPLAHVTDNSSDDEVHDASAAPLPAEADFMYSYDAPSGPAAGRDILSAALNKAVLRFENIETEKLVTREYDVIDQLKEDSMAEDEEDDFEMIEHAHLK
jgi:hypothetical protein